MANRLFCSFPHLRVREVGPIYFTMLAVFMILLIGPYKALPSRSRPPVSGAVRSPRFVQMSWNVSYPEKVIYFQILIKDLKFGLISECRTRGEFAGADLIVLSMKSFLCKPKDAWSDQQGRLHLDSQQDYELLKARQSPEDSTFSLKDHLSRVIQEDYTIEDGTVHVIYALLEKPTQFFQLLTSSLPESGTSESSTLKPDIPIAQLPRDVINLDVRAPWVLIPAQETTYWCYITELPKDFPKHHIVMYEPVITKGHEAIVHHIEVFQCDVGYQTILATVGPATPK
ncbi:hypothetical protein GDO86_014840 [Hymenochirus boettgeri]|uniref:Dopamine beta-hydroxylase n=1 Tax=Hymenochirus boettgeri TaxID=247094 RepID=A0A8T2JYK4_9PIPI|nr:hypothetical protein GDO86_014840 [Hymenochirus boettgeri]